jgi:hypothetical protein
MFSIHYTSVKKTALEFEIVVSFVMHAIFHAKGTNHTEHIKTSKVRVCVLFSGTFFTIIKVRKRKSGVIN